MGGLEEHGGEVQWKLLGEEQSLSTESLEVASLGS